MKKTLLLIIICLAALCGHSQTPLHSYICSTSTGYQGFSQAQMDTMISRANFESFRLQNTRTTLHFDNGYTVTLLSAAEMSATVSNVSAASYAVSFPPGYKVPVFHLTAQGHFTAEYTADPHTKSRGR